MFCVDIHAISSHISRQKYKNFVAHKKRNTKKPNAFREIISLLQIAAAAMRQPYNTTIVGLSHRGSRTYQQTRRRPPPDGRLLN